MIKQFRVLNLSIHNNLFGSKALIAELSEIKIEKIPGVSQPMYGFNNTSGELFIFLEDSNISSKLQREPEEIISLDVDEDFRKSPVNLGNGSKDANLHRDIFMQMMMNNFDRLDRRF